MMNPSSWCNPPPPGIEMDDESKHSNVSSAKSYAGSVIDQIDPYIKNPEYVRYKKDISSERTRRRSTSRPFERCRSKSRSRERRRKYRSRSRSHGRCRDKRSRSRSRGRRHRRYSHSSSRSRSRSSSLTRNRYKHKRKKPRRSRSRSRSHDRRRHERKHYRSHSRQNESLAENEHNDNGEEEEVEAKENAFKNDGSFLEMFKKMQEEKQKAEAEKNVMAATPVASCSEVKKPLPVFGKRRGGRVLKTGMVEKTKAVEDDEFANATDPWSIYLKEVKRYKEACCDDDSKTRPLVK